VNLTYVARDFLRITTKVDRDVDYSYDALTPYYVSTGAVHGDPGNRIRLGCRGPRDPNAVGVPGDLGRSAPGTAAALARTDFVVEIGAGVGRV
jgi:hypothetical protein